jgi:hypothetical protein
MIWNESNNLIDQQMIKIPVKLTNTENGTSGTSGAFIIAGGVLKKDVFVDGKIYFTGSNLPIQLFIRILVQIH